MFPKYCQSIVHHCENRNKVHMVTIGFLCMVIGPFHSGYVSGSFVVANVSIRRYSRTKNMKFYQSISKCLISGTVIHDTKRVMKRLVKKDVPSTAPITRLGVTCLISPCIYLCRSPNIDSIGLRMTVKERSRKKVI